VKHAISKEKDMTIYSIYKKNHTVAPKEVVTVVDLGYLGIERIIQQNNYHRTTMQKEEKSVGINYRRKKSITKFIQKRG
jgi:hypothetical protein